MIKNFCVLSSYIRVDIVALWKIPLYNIVRKKGLSLNVVYVTVSAHDSQANERHPPLTAGSDNRYFASDFIILRKFTICLPHKQNT